MCFLPGKQLYPALPLGSKGKWPLAPLHLPTLTELGSVFVASCCLGHIVLHCPHLLLKSHVSAQEWQLGTHSRYVSSGAVYINGLEMWPSLPSSPEGNRGTLPPA